jgi:Ca2+-binding EF-hand superfamily protein
MARTGRNMPEIELNHILTEACSTNGKITFDEFCKIMMEGGDRE